MKAESRAAVAAIALGHARGNSVSSIFDYANAKYRNVSVQVDGQRIRAFDYERACYVDGSLPSLFHYGDASYIDLKPTSGGRYSGFDYACACYFDVTVKGNNVEIFDYEAGSYFSYSA